MRNIQRLAPLALVALTLSACNKPASPSKVGGEAAATKADAVAIPARKAGLWEQTILHDGRPAMGPIGSKISLCLDADTDRTISVFGRQASRDVCQRHVLTRGPDGSFAFSSSCALPSGGTVTSKGAASGDFASNYVVRTESDVSGAPFERMNGHHVMQMTATWKGPCPSGMKPGDMMTAAGFKVNMGDMMGRPLGAAAGGDDSN